MENVIPKEEAIMNTTDPAKAPIGQAGIMPEEATIPTGGDAVQPSAESVIGVRSVDAESPPQQTPVKQDADRYEYWQSKHDRTAGELSQVRKELDYYKQTLGPVAEAVQQNPNVLKNFQQSPSNEPPAQEQNSLKAPSRPEKPHSYNEVDAYNDPDSDSFKYRLANDKYRDDMIDYYGKVDNYRQEQAAVAYEQQREAMAQNQATSYAVQSLGWEPSKAQHAIQWLQNPDNVSFETLFKVYEMAHAPAKEAAVAQQRAAEAQQREQRMQVPQSTAVASGTSQAPMSDEQMFNQGMMSWKK